MSFTIRPIEAHDDAAVAAIIRAVMPEFGADGPGFAIHDAEVGAMHAAYAKPGRIYFVVELDGKVCGGAGVAPLDGEAGTCELRKMYFLPELRGRGAGDALMRRCLEAARALGYRRCYLETLTGMDAAQKLYARHGFACIPAAMGATGHFSCNRFYLRDLGPTPPPSRD
ncbi:MAG TPA: GNAT family N-acetyltransferase [Rudaea sp.]|nr:GNAT family N-acetyltransferase [Rudaea sp.]